MKPLALIAVSAAALTAAGCGPKVPPARAALDCPPTEGELTRTGVSGDGKACTYVSADGAEVTLQLVPVTGGPDATLQRIENTLLAGRQAPKPKAEADAKPDRSAQTGEADDVARAAREAAQDAGASGVAEAPEGVNVEVVKDGQKTVVIRDGAVTEVNGKTRVELPGIRVIADENTDSAEVRVGPITVNAGDERMEFRLRRDVRLKGEALNPQKRGLRATFIYTGEDLPEGYRFVGYEAGGPKTGPLAVAVVRSKIEGPGGDELQDDVQRLVRKNGGV